MKFFKALQKFGNNVADNCKKGAEKVKEGAKKGYAAALTALGLGIAGATDSHAAVTYDAATKSLTGNVEMGAYESAIPIVLAVMGLTITVALMFGLFSKAKRG